MNKIKALKIIIILYIISVSGFSQNKDKDVTIYKDVDPRISTKEFHFENKSPQLIFNLSRAWAIHSNGDSIRITRPDRIEFKELSVIDAKAEHKQGMLTIKEYKRHPVIITYDIILSFNGKLVTMQFKNIVAQKKNIPIEYISHFTHQKSQEYYKLIHEPTKVSMFATPTHAFSQNDVLKNDIEKIIRGKRATVGVALIVDGKDTLTVNNGFHYPTQSTYKFHLALAVLDYLNKNNLSLDHKIFIRKAELLPDTHSPLRDDYPDGNVELPVSEILKYTVSQSDNNGCDILFRFVGGTPAVDRYIRDLGFSDFAIAATEEEMHGPWEVQYTNWSTPLTAARVLEKFRTGNILPQHFHDFLWNAMVDTTTGPKKIKGLLPPGTIVAHKTGSSFRNAEGLNAAENDIAIIRLPDGRYYSLAVFVADSMEDEATNMRMIAEISRAVYDSLTK